MRQLVRVVIAAAALLGVLGLPAPVAAETAEQCQATLNSYRAKAGLDKASSTSATAAALGRAAGKHPGYRVNEDVTTATGIPAARLEGVRSWVDAPYHRLPLMDANTRHIGCSVSERVVDGRTYSAEVLEMAATWKDTTRRITVYPANGQTGVPVSFNRCQEHPTPFGGPCDPAHPVQNVGYVVTFQADGYYAMKIQGIGFSRGSSGSPVAIHRAVRYRTTKSTVAASSVDTNLPTNAAMLAATAPLAPQTRYNVRVSGYVQATKGGKWVQFKTRTWSFTTA